ncbi:MAG: cupin domain-containing protein [bacterium]|nr:cupin domain-containing protein [bacterium]
MSNEKANLAHKFTLFSDQWSPRVIAEANGQYVKLAKVQGEFVWHAHADEDEIFFVVSGRLLIHMRDRTVELLPGELFVVPKGVEHAPEAPDETHIMLIEPKQTTHTGDVVTERTVAVADQGWI